MIRDVSVRLCMWVFPSAKTVQVGRGCCCNLWAVRSCCLVSPSRASLVVFVWKMLTSGSHPETHLHGFSIAPQLVINQSQTTSSPHNYVEDEWIVTNLNPVLTWRP